MISCCSLRSSHAFQVNFPTHGTRQRGFQKQAFPEDLLGDLKVEHSFRSDVSTRFMHWTQLVITDRLKEAALAIFSMAAAVDLGKESYRALLLGKGWPSHRTRGQHPRSPSPVFFLCWMWRMNFQNGPSYVGCCILSTFLHLLKGLKISPHFFRHWNNSGCGPWKKPQPGSKLCWSSRRSMHRS